MLIECDRQKRQYRIALNNMSNGAELAADLSYLEGVPAGVLTFDFTHMAAGLTQETREAYLPGNFGFQPTISLLEIVSTIASFTERAAICPHHLAVVLRASEFFRVSSFGIRHFQLVPDPVNRFDPVRLVRIPLELGTQAGNMIVHCARGREGGVAPNHIQEPLA